MSEQFSVIRPLCDFIKPSHDPKALINVLDALTFLLDVLAKDQRKFNERKKEILECGGLYRIEHLKKHTDEEVKNKAIYTIDRYFDSSEVFTIRFTNKSEFYVCAPA